MNIKQIEAFVQVAEKRNFSEAARSLYLTQPTISAHITSLEKELKARLLERSTKKVVLSEDGKKVYSYAKQIVELLNSLEEEFREDADREECVFSIATSTVPSQYLLPTILSEFSERYPHIRFQVTEMDSGNVIDAVMNKTADIGLTGTRFERKNCEYIPFYEDELLVITPNNELFRKRKAESKLEEWLSKEAFVMREKKSGTRREALRILSMLGIEERNLHVVASIENTETLKKAVSSGMGISVVSGLSVQEEIKNGEVLAFQIEETNSKRNIYLVFNQIFSQNDLTKKFIKTIDDIYRKE